MTREKEDNKVRTSITISPDLLTAIRRDAKVSVSAYIEEAVRFFRANAPVEDTGVVNG
jgi:post-segregation antitoxin (ccd killing protein)